MKRTAHNPHPDQLGFDALLAKAETDNHKRTFDRATAHLPGTMDPAIPYFRDLIQRNHAAILAADEAATRAIHQDAHQLAVKLNGGEHGILAHDDAPGYVLARETTANPSDVPLWGQTGSFIIEVSGMAVRIEMEGLFGIGAGWGFWSGFSARAVHWDKPFLSETGYRSFLGIHADPAPGLTPNSFTAKVIEAHIARELRGKPVRIGEQWRRGR